MIHVLAYELLVHEAQYKNTNSGTLQQSTVMGRTWNKIIVYNLDQTFNGSRSNVAKIFASSVFVLMYLPLVHNTFNTPNLANYKPL